MSRIDNAERERVFGPPCRSSNHRSVLTPWGIRVTAHFLVVPRFAAACELAKRASSWSPRRIDSYSCRPIRNSRSYSIHAWAMAWDFFATPPNVPPPGGVWTPDNGVPSDFAAAFEQYGFVWGGNFGRKDVPHIEWASGRPAAITSGTPLTTLSPPILGTPMEVDVQIQPIQIEMPLDNEGRGNLTVPYHIDRIAGFLPHSGVRPNVDGRYDTPVNTVTFTPDGAGTVVVCQGGDPLGRAVLWLRVIV